MHDSEIKFKDFNFKLAVINKLMYENNIIAPQFNIHSFIENYTQRNIDYEEEGYEIIPEAKKYFENISISKSDVENIEELYQDGGNDVYMNICPLWDGEDDIFNIQFNTHDCDLLPNLKSITLFYDDDKSILEKFKDKGINAKWL